ncbi:putative peptide transport fused subunits of ABC superfamily: ATP-binding components [Bradyrhizobium sp. ORS 375]|uniref:dipeptide ABC transporter ATP-binding protein n=1 Tax=Bradyrhizobium sp. (strain ORS 375) TaxID=566679 RepID=UPI0002407AD2|nr:ABC transporter ATP-binding protein [Bradyrhizobium sp. ORS 375]CCD95716.1 putative peptide transport fused subunits of ABC superfamily: ATP-binding components [Bradyrhizobium sp. ORS 375]
MLKRSDPPLLSIDGLAVEFDTPHGRVRALDHVSFDIGAAEIVGIVGESGSGKSVTAYSILGLLPRQARVRSGSVTYLGRSLLGLRESELKAIRGSEISMVFQSPQTALNPIRPVGAQISDVLRAHSPLRGRDADRRAVEALDAVHIQAAERRVHAYPFEMSGGMCQRSLIAMALACTPRLLLADEPTTGLDVTTQKAIMELLVELNRSRGMSTMFITHDLGLAAQYCDRVIIMERGRVVEHGPTAQIFSRPQHVYTRKLLSATPQGHDRLTDLIPASERQDFGPVRQRSEAAPAPGPVKEPVLSVQGLTHDYVLQKQPRILSNFILPWRSRPNATTPALFRAVDDLSFEVHHGECVGLVGESGSGKTTTSRLIAKLVKPSAGSIRLHGEEIADADPRSFARSAKRRLIQIVFQDPASSLDPRRTAFEAIADPLLRLERLKGSEELERRIHGICDLVEFPKELLGRYPHQLSGGQKARVGIGRAISVNPALVVLDEPTSALDVSVQAVVLNQLDKLKRALGLSYLFVSHDLNIVRLMCDRVMVMKGGQIVEQATVADLFSRPQHAYTKALLDAIPRIEFGGAQAPFSGFERSRLSAGAVAVPRN